MIKDKLRAIMNAFYFFSVCIVPLNLDVPQSNTEQQNK